MTPAVERARVAAKKEFPDFVRFVADQLARWAPVAVRRLFGGHALYRGNTVFAIVSRDTLYLRTDTVNRGDFEAAGAKPFRPGSGHITLPYHEAPPDALEEPDLLARWAASAYEAALRRDAGKAQKRNRPRRRPLKNRKG
jgi:DNA transformation protein